jgi:hypothetical protein
VNPRRRAAVVISVAIDIIVVVLVFRTLLHHGAPMLRVIIPAVALFVLSGAIVVFAFRQR